MNRLAGLIDVGRGTGSALGQLGAQSASNIGNLLQNQANALAGAQLGASQARSNIIGQGIGLAGLVAGGGFGGAGGTAAGGGLAGFMQPTQVPSIGFQPTGLY